MKRSGPYLDQLIMGNWHREYDYTEAEMRWPGKKSVRQPSFCFNPVLPELRRKAFVLKLLILLSLISCHPAPGTRVAEMVKDSKIDDFNNFNWTSVKFSYLMLNSTIVHIVQKYYSIFVWCGQRMWSINISNKENESFWYSFQRTLMAFELWHVNCTIHLPLKI